MTYDVTDKNFEDTMAKNNCLVIIDFYRNECPPCEGAKPIFESVAKLHHEKVLFLKMDTDTNPDIPEQLNVQHTPTFLFFRNHKQVDKMVGLSPNFEKMLLHRISTYQ